LKDIHHHKKSLPQNQTTYVHGDYNPQKTINTVKTNRKYNNTKERHKKPNCKNKQKTQTATATVEDTFLYIPSTTLPAPFAHKNVFLLNGGPSNIILFGCWLRVVFKYEYKII
jgi:hypothetical protein